MSKLSFGKIVTIWINLSYLPISFTVCRHIIHSLRFSRPDKYRHWIWFTMFAHPNVTGIKRFFMQLEFHCLVLCIKPSFFICPSFLSGTRRRIRAWEMKAPMTLQEDSFLVASIKFGTTEKYSKKSRSEVHVAQCVA